MRDLPISLALFTSTKGHFSRVSDFRVTLDHWDKQIPLSRFNLIAHIKVSPGQEALGDQMRDELVARGFHVIQTKGAWARGLSHGAAYLGDMVTVSKCVKVYERPYFLLLEDDSPVISHKLSLEDLLLQSCQFLEKDHELISVRLIRRGDYEGGVPEVIKPPRDNRFFFSPNTDFQPTILRSLHYYLLCMQLEQNPQLCEQVHCERLWRLILDNFSRSPYRYMVYRPDFAETVHIGVSQEDYSAAITKLS